MWFFFCPMRYRRGRRRRGGRRGLARASCQRRWGVGWNAKHFLLLRLLLLRFHRFHHISIVRFRVGIFFETRSWAAFVQLAFHPREPMNIPIQKPEWSTVVHTARCREVIPQCRGGRQGRKHRCRHRGGGVAQGCSLGSRGRRRGRGRRRRHERRPSTTTTTTTTTILPPPHFLP